jgi:hypothetical protein
MDEKQIQTNEIKEKFRNIGGLFNFRNLTILAIFGILLGLLFWQNFSSKRQLANLKSQLKVKDSSLDEEKKNLNLQLVAMVGKLVVLPENEQPTIATVGDVEKLKDQPFFKNAQVGDKVLIYNQAKKAVLYRPSENKIIELAPLTVGETQNLTSLNSKTEKSVKSVSVEIRNGSGTSGAAGVLKTKLSSNSAFVVSKIGNANSTYSKTIIYSANSAKFPELFSALKQETLAEIVTSLPEQETESSSDVLIILGKQ